MVEAPLHRDRSGAVILARAIIVVLAATVGVGVARATRDARDLDSVGAGFLWLWAWLLSPLSGGMAGALIAATGRPRRKLRQTALIFVGAVGGELLAVVTCYVTLINTDCHNPENDLCGLGLFFGMVLGSGSLLFVLTAVSAVLLLVSHQPRERSWLA